MIDRALTLGDSELMVLVKSGDVRAFALFFDRHSTAAFSLAMRILNDRGLAADASQEAFLAFWRHRGVPARAERRQNLAAEHGAKLCDRRVASGAKAPRRSPRRHLSRASALG